MSIELHNHMRVVVQAVVLRPNESCQMWYNHQIAYLQTSFRHHIKPCAQYTTISSCFTMEVDEDDLIDFSDPEPEPGPTSVVLHFA